MKVFLCVPIFLCRGIGVPLGGWSGLWLLVGVCVLVGGTSGRGVALDFVYRGQVVSQV